LELCPSQNTKHTSLAMRCKEKTLGNDVGLFLVGPAKLESKDDDGDFEREKILNFFFPF